MGFAFESDACNRWSQIQEAIRSSASGYRSITRELELVVSDTCSTGQTSVICERAARDDSRVRYNRQPRTWVRLGTFGEF